MSHSGFADILKNRGFQAFLWTQFLGAFNDNCYKIIVSMRAVHVAASSDGGSTYLTLAMIVFVLPFLLFSGYAGHLADIISKRRVLVAVKAFEIFIMLCGLAAFFTTRIEWMLVVLFLLAVHSAVFSPAKYGIVPEMLPDRDLSRANALLEMSTFVAIVAGTAIGTFLFDAWKGEPWKIGVVLLVIAVAGFMTSLKITRVPAAGAAARLRWNPLAEVVEGTRHLLRDRPLWLTVLAISYFWFLGALFQSSLLLYGKETLHGTDAQIGLLVTYLAIGIGAGSMLAGRLSGNKVELGLVPLGGMLMSIFCFALYAARGSYTASAVVLALLGIASGLFIVPLNAFLQQRAGAQEKGRLIATNNIYNTAGLLLAAGALWLCHDVLRMTPEQIILASGLATAIATIYIVTVVDDFLIRFVLWMVTHTIFRIKIAGQENVPFRGPALLVSNHMTHVDGFFIGASLQRFIRFMVWKPYYEIKPIRWVFRKMKAIPVSAANRRDMVEAIRAARAELQAGHVVCIFAEGAISRTGNMLPFKRGLEKIVDGLDVPVIPVHLDRLWGSIFSYEGGKFFWKWPKAIPYPVTVSFGAPMPSTSTAQEVRQAIQELSAGAVAHRKSTADRLDRRAIRMARRHWNRFAMADSTGRELTCGRMLTGSFMVANWVRRHSRDHEMIGVLLPSTVAGALVNIGTTIARRIPVNLNFTAGNEAMLDAMAQCGIQTVISSRAFLTKAGIDAQPGTVFVEDILARAGKLEKFRALLQARFAPARRGSPDDLATVIFSSGSTGVPKGVMLSHYNVISNIEAMGQVFWTGPDDRIVGVLPFFHSFGFTVTIWFPTVSGCGVVYHANPTDASTIGKLVEKYRATLMLSTPTFCSTYIRKCSEDEFASLRHVLVGAEKLRQPVADAFREKFGLELLEGYGCTEMSPVVAVNAPSYEAGKDSQIASKPGTVGHPLPGVAARVVDPESFEPRPTDAEGLLLVKGANRMLGYLGQPEKTAASLHDGWYVTGDIAVIDDEGFLRITDRLSRFSKIGGEMVPHLKVEEAIAGVLDCAPCAVTAVPDALRGERLIVVYVEPRVSPTELWQRLADTGLPRLWLPKRENVFQVDALPLLGTGKLDLRALKLLAQELVGTAA